MFIRLDTNFLRIIHFDLELGIMLYRVLTRMLLTTLPFVAMTTVAQADIVITGSFGPNGDVGFANSPSNLGITFGTNGNGTASQLNGFVNSAGGPSLNNDGSGFGTSADLSYGPPPQLTYSFSSQLSTAHTLVLTYSFTNVSGITLPGFQFLSFVDPDIGSDIADETASLSGSLGTGATFSGATSYQVGDPTTSTLFTNELFGTLDNTNAFPPGTPGDVAIGLGFTIGNLTNGAKAQFQIMLSDNGTTLGGFGITVNDPVFTSYSLTVSGQVTMVPEPSAWLTCTLGLVSMTALSARRKHLALGRTSSSPPTS